ncbi:MAG: hypothetical protein KDD03_04520, partial [Gelidibacter sp.]|nr:hypothetical protein [Gelidibacter sp.]
PDIIMSQEDLKKQMEDAMKKGDEGKPDEDENGNKSGEGKEGKDGIGKGSPNGNEQGEGEGNSEKMNGELYQIYQQQAQLRQALQDRLGEAGTKGEGKQLLKDMEDIELDLINKGFTNQTLQKMMDLQHQLLKMENATFLQGEDTKRQSKTNTKQYQNDVIDQIPTAKEYFNTTEILNRQALPLQQVYKKKVQDYFKKDHD